MNRLLKAGCSVYWLTNPVEKLGSGAIWVPATAAVRPDFGSGGKAIRRGRRGGD